MSFTITNSYANPFKNTIVEVQESGKGPAEFTFVTSNEVRKKEVLSALAKQPIEGQVMLAVSWLFALNILAVRGTESSLPGKKIEWLLLIGIEPNRKLFWKHLKATIRTCEHPQDAKAKIFRIMDRYQEKLFATNDPNPVERESWMQLEKGEQKKELNQECAASLSWLSSEEKYSFIREHYFLRKRIKVRTCNLYDPACMASIAQALIRAGLKFDTLYLSNVPSLAYLIGTTSLFRKAFPFLVPATTPHTLLIDTKPILKTEFVPNAKSVLQLRVRRNIPKSPISDIIQDYQGVQEILNELLP